MLGKKGEDQRPSEEDVLVQRVDEMMDVNASKKTSSETSSVQPNTTDSPPPLDIFESQKQADAEIPKTAPVIPGQTVKPEPVASTPSKATKPSAPPIVEANDAKPDLSKNSDPETTIESPSTEPPTNDIGADNENGPLDIPDAVPEIENSETDKAVEDIVAAESDQILAVEDAVKKNNELPATQPTKPHRRFRLRAILKDKRTWAVVAVLLITLFAIPQTRYTILGLFIKKQVSIVVVDSKTGTPVSNSHVTIAGSTEKTDANGKAKLNASLGQDTLSVSKQYYKTSNSKYFVGFKSPPIKKIALVAVGRQVPISVVNKITGKPVANAEIKILKTTAKTNKNGQAVVVLPADANLDEGLIKAAGYNATKMSVLVTDQKVKQNIFSVTPSGHVYFLSNQSGKIDVVSTNLDGTNRQVVLAGTGKEDVNSTSLLASRDWRYAVLKSKREGIRPVLYLIDTSNNKVTQFDGSNGDFYLIGWYGHSFAYSVISNSVQQSQNGHQVIKSYDAERQQLNQLDQTQADGWPSTYGYQTFDNFFIVNNLLAYTVQWSVYDATGAGHNLADKKDSIRAVQPVGQGRKDYQSFRADTVSYMQAALSSPQTILYAVYGNDGKRTFYKFENQTVAVDTSIDQSDINKKYPIYYVSPSGTQSFWSDLRDGNNTLFVGDASAKDPKRVAVLGDYLSYGWYSDKYLLVSKNDNQLFIMPVGGPTGSSQPLKVTDYFKSGANVDANGYSYGGQ